MNKIALVAMGLAALAAGCKKKAADNAAKPPPAAQDAAAAAVADAAADVVDAAPPPLTPPVPAGKVGIQILDLQYAGIATPGLPAIKADGSQFAVTVVADDGGRGYLDLKLRLLDAATAKVSNEWVLADPEKTSAAETEDGVTPALVEATRKQVGDVNTALAGSAWRSLAPVELPADGNRNSDEPTALTAAGTTFTYQKGKLTIAAAAGAPLVKTYQQLTGQKPPGPGKDDDECSSESEYLQAVAVDAESKRALIVFDFQSGHNCGTAGQVYGTVALP